MKKDPKAILALVWNELVVSPNHPRQAAIIHLLRDQPEAHRMRIQVGSLCPICEQWDTVMVSYQIPGHRRQWPIENCRWFCGYCRRSSAGQRWAWTRKRGKPVETPFT